MNELRDHSLAKSYGQAVFDLAEERDALDESFEEICLVDELLKVNPDLSNFLITPFVPTTEKLKLVNTTFGDKISETILNFVCILIKNSRTSIFSHIKDYYSEKYDESLGYLHVGVTLDREIDGQAEKDLREKLEKTTGKKIKMKKVIDPSILGGVVINCRDMVVDNSVKGALERAVKHIKGIK